VTLSEEQLTATVENVVAQKLQTGQSTYSFSLFYIKSSTFIQVPIGKNRFEGKTIE